MIKPYEEITKHKTKEEALDFLKKIARNHLTFKKWQITTIKGSKSLNLSIIGFDGQSEDILAIANYEN